MDKAATLFDSLLNGTESVTTICKDKTISSIDEALRRTKSDLERFPTGKLWLQYMHMIDVLRRFLKAERTGQWELHIASVSEMLPFMAAAGHHLYTKSLLLYLKDMQDLEKTHPDVHAKFKEGFHVTRRSDRLWGGLSTDLTIEQCLMRSLKVTGGPARGHGMSEAHRTTWLLSMPACAELNGAMQDFTGQTYKTSEQHQDMSASRVKRDENDIREMTCFLQTRSPFEESTNLKNIVTGVVGDTSFVDVHKAGEIGNKILQNMNGKSIKEFSFSRSMQAKTMAASSKNAVQIESDVVVVDPQLLFQRLTAAAESMSYNNRDLFRYELSSFPTSLFETPFILRPPTKSDLADELWKAAQEGMPVMPRREEIQYVLDVGAILHIIPWQRGATIASILKTYCDYVTKAYGSPIIVFDGYLGTTTKNIEHLRRGSRRESPVIEFSAETTILAKKEDFLNNLNNKHRFLSFLCHVLQQKSCTAIQTEGDADTMVVAQALECSKSGTTVVIADDTDILVLLCCLAKGGDNDIFLQPSHRTRKASPKRFWSIQHTQRSIGNLTSILPVIHAVSGCDTTSRIFGLGKRGVLKKFKHSEELQKLASEFVGEGAKQESVVRAGEGILLELYGGAQCHSDLDDLRFSMFASKIATASSYIQVNSLPPTCAAAKYHSLRVYLQIQQWFGATTLEPQEWGWKLKDTYLLPVTTDLPPAPPTLLSVIRCGCKTGCDTKSCSCRKNGIDCSPACKECKGQTCTNAEQFSCF